MSNYHIKHLEEYFQVYRKSVENPENFWKEIKTIFTDAEITDLAYCTAGWMGMGRVAHVLGLDKGCEI